MSKNIVICCDGTGQEFGAVNTNVVALYSVVRAGEQQVAFYDPGVGTGGWEYADDSGLDLRARADAMTGTGLQNNVNDAYKILMRAYEDGDHVYLFGFSRGAFTVRSLAGMLFKVGLLRPNNDNLVPYAAELYNRADNASVAAEFKATFGRACPVHCIGVWDTVDSLVLNAGKRFHDTAITPETAHAFQALAIDEKRNDFKACRWDEGRVRADQHVDQVWFAGVHSDVGGGYVERGLANCSLQWMIDKSRGCGLQVDDDKARTYAPDPLDVLHDSYDGIWWIRGTHVRAIASGARVHQSVVTRLQAAGAGYAPENWPVGGVGALEVVE